MTIVYDWFVPDTLNDPAGAPDVALSLDGLTDVIVGTSWACRGTDDSTNPPTVAQTNGYVPLNAPADPASFVPFDQVTPDVLKGWLFRKLSQPDVEGKVRQMIVEKQVVIERKPLVAQ